MRIAEHTDRRLVLEHRPWLLAVLAWGLGIAAVAGALFSADYDSLAERALVFAIGCGTLFLAWRFFAFLRIVFDRESGWIEHRRLRPFGSGSKFLALSKVEGARIEANWSDGARLTRLILETEDGPAPLEFGYDSQNRQEIEQTINDWLTRPL